MDVSIILVNYNTKDLILNCINSIYASETGYSFEIIMVDNASTDGSVEAVRNEFSGVLIINNSENSGFAKANNQAAQIASGRYLYILNSDTEIEKNVIQEVVAYGDTMERVGIIGTKVISPDGTLQHNFYKFPDFLSELIFFTVNIVKTSDLHLMNLKKYRNYAPDEHFNVDVISGCSMFVKREVYAGTGLFDESFFMYYEDGEFCFRVKRGGYTAVYMPSVCVTHIHMGSGKEERENFNLLVSCFDSACIYFQRIRGNYYSNLFRVSCKSIWFIELIVLRSILTAIKRKKITRKISMIKALLQRGE